MTDIIGALRQPEVRQRSLVLVASLLFMLVGTGSIYFIVVALKQISAEFAWPRAVPSIAYALQYGGAGLGGIFMGWLLDRRGMMIPAFIGATMVGLGAILTSFIQTQWELFFIYGVMLGFFGRSSLFAPLTANITRWFEHNKSLAVGIVGSGQGLAGLMCRRRVASGGVALRTVCPGNYAAAGDDPAKATARRESDRPAPGRP